MVLTLNFNTIEYAVHLPLKKSFAVKLFGKLYSYNKDISFYNRQLKLLNKQKHSNYHHKSC